MIHCAIDPGKSGGIAVLDENGKILHLWIMPVINSTKSLKEYDIPKIAKIFETLKEQYSGNINIILEKATIIPISGSKSIASTFYCNGIFQGILTSFKLPFQIVRAIDWQKIVFVGMNRKDTKQASIMFCQRKYPDQDFRPTERSRNPSDGLTDAVCMAYYSLLQYK